jgi:hypothetical protein
MQKYIEELNSGECFKFQDQYWICGSDFKKDGSRSVLSLITGFCRWFGSDEIVTPVQVYTMDKDNNIIAIKETKKDEPI